MSTVGGSYVSALEKNVGSQRDKTDKKIYRMSLLKKGWCYEKQYFAHEGPPTTTPNHRQEAEVGLTTASLPGRQCLTLKAPKSRS